MTTLTKIEEEIIISFDNFRNFDGSEYGSVLHDKIKQFLRESIKKVADESRKEMVDELLTIKIDHDTFWGKNIAKPLQLELEKQLQKHLQSMTDKKSK